MRRRAAGRTSRHGLALVTLAALALTCRAPADASPLGESDLALLGAATWGVSASSAAEFERLGPERWLAGQLHPERDATLPEPVRRQIEASPGFGRPLPELIRELQDEAKAANAIPDEEARKAALKQYQGRLAELYRGATGRATLQALYGQDQLAQRLGWFWLNHFNVHQGKANLRAMVGDYLDTAIRPHALGRFRDLLEATLRHPAMLRYLDNADNAAGRLNENYARELMELHTMGVGSGYGQADVEALAKILTGVGIDPNPADPKLKPDWQKLLVRQGLFIFNPARHDFSDKVLLGHPIRGSGFGEVSQALDILSRHPATALHVSRRLATYFVGDDPPKAIVDRMAETFRTTDGDIAQVMKAMLTAPDFAAARRRHVKDPMGFVLSALRLAYDDKVILNTQPVQGWLNRLAEGWFNHTTPDGYGLGSAGWTGPGQMTTRFEIARQIGGGPAGLFKPATPQEGQERPGFPVLQNALYFSTLKASLAPATIAALDQATSPQDWNALFLSSPDFMR